MFCDTQEQIRFPFETNVNFLDKKFPREPFKNEFFEKKIKNSGLNDLDSKSGFNVSSLSLQGR